MNRKRVLIVDDEAGFTRLLRLNLCCTGRYTVRAETHALEALAAVGEFHPDLILLDVMMPELDGGELAARLRSSPATRDIPIVFVTAAVKRDEVAAHHGLIGGLCYLAKPVELHELIECIDSQLANAAMARTAPASGAMLAAA
jgi:CheY-like chemotaxis protein